MCNLLKVLFGNARKYLLAYLAMTFVNWLFAYPAIVTIHDPDVSLAHHVRDLAFWPRRTRHVLEHFFEGHI